MNKRILMVGRASVFTDSGGDTIQMRSTAKYLEMLLGCDCHTVGASSLGTVSIDDYDVIHFFSLIDASDFLVFAERAAISGKRIVLSPIYVDYSEYERKARLGLVKHLSKILPRTTQQYLKNALKMLLRKRPFDVSYLMRGHAYAVKKLLLLSDVVLPNSNSEMQRMSRDFCVVSDAKVVRNGVDTAFFPLFYGGERPIDVICVGRIEERKNQLNLIKAAIRCNFSLVLIGSFAENQVRYREKCLKLVSASNLITVKERLPQCELKNLMRKSKIHALPSWFETTGLVSLEAASQGCRIVISDKGDVRDYFRSDVEYCDPMCVESISAALLAALKKQPNDGFARKVSTYFTWELAAKDTFQAYSESYFI